MTHPTTAMVTFPTMQASSLELLQIGFGTSIQAILGENPNIVAANDIKPGDVIWIPNLRGGKGLAVIRAWKDEHTVQDGDTLKHIANQFTTRVRAFKKVNPSIPDTDEIRRGQIIRIPG